MRIYIYLNISQYNTLTTFVEVNKSENFVCKMVDIFIGPNLLIFSRSLAFPISDTDSFRHASIY